MPNQGIEPCLPACKTGALPSGSSGDSGAELKCPWRFHATRNLLNQVNFGLRRRRYGLPLSYPLSM